MGKQNEFKASVNQQFKFDQLTAKNLDVIALGNGRFHLIHNHQSYQAELMAANYSTKSFTFKINGTNYEVQLEDKYDELINQLGFSSSLSQKVKDIKAPMPGLVLEIDVTVGQVIKKGTPILILEAMKMENVIKSPGDGVVKIIHVAKGIAVEKGLVLVELE